MKIFKQFNLLYVEDNKETREETYSFLKDYFANVYVADNGNEGLRIFLNEKVDLILSDINMPQLNGIQMSESIREKNKDVPIVFITNYFETDLLLQAIKLKVSDYLIKPVKIEKLINSMEVVVQQLHKKNTSEHQRKELEQYKEILDSNDIVIKLNPKMKITYVNEMFCKITGFKKEELLSKDFKELRFPDVQEELFDEIYKKVLEDKRWRGIIKYFKNGNLNYYLGDTSIVANFDKNNLLMQFVVIQRDVTLEINKKRKVQLALMRDKTNIFQKGKESIANLDVENADLKIKIKDYKKKYLLVKKKMDQAKREINENIFQLKKNEAEIKELKLQLMLLERNASKQKFLKLVKENSDAKYEIKKLKIDKENEVQTQVTKNNQIREDHREKVDNLEARIKIYKNKLANLKSAEVLQQQLEYWKEKAEVTEARLENIEKMVIKYGDEDFMANIFKK